MKLLRVIASMDPVSGGPCQGIRNSIPEQEKLGVHNEVLCLDGPSASYLGKDNFPIQTLGPAENPWRYTKEFVPWLVNNLAQYDAVIVHGLWLFHGFAVLKALKILRKKSPNKLPRFFVMPHGMLDPYFQKAEGRKLKALRNVLYWKFIESEVVNGADGVLFTCEQELLLARKPFKPYRPKRELNIGYGVPAPPGKSEAQIKAFQNICPGLNGASYILFLSRVHEKKGVDFLIQAYLNTKAQHPDLPIPKLVVAGPGMDTEYGGQLEKVAAGDPDILFPGMLSGDAKWGAFYGCEAFVLPSHQENFGIAVAEALACGKPVLISDQVNIWREIKEGGGGMVAPDTLEGTERLLMAWFEMEAEGKKDMGLNARKVFEGKFSIGPAAQRMVEVIGDVI
ncbi:glycosyltransferase [Cytophagaceae bacterium ABcell3]|nr:glycosyltransferase [Cytophagaceae bacterium ABcell3]